MFRFIISEFGYRLRPMFLHKRPLTSTLPYDRSDSRSQTFVLDCDANSTLNRGPSGNFTAPVTDAPLQVHVELILVLSLGAPCSFDILEGDFTNQASSTASHERHIPGRHRV